MWKDDKEAGQKAEEPMTDQLYQLPVVAGVFFFLSKQDSTD